MARSKSRRFADLIGKDSIVDSGNALVGGGAVTTYSSIDALPLSGNDAGDQAFVSENNRLYIWTGDGWYNIALVNTDPSIQANSYSSSYELSTEGTATTVTLIASDPEGVPITWTYANSGLGSIATITQSNNVFTITPTSNAELGGTFSVTFKASDGVNLATATSEFTLNFVTLVENSKYTSALITSVGSNGGSNYSIVDSSSNNHTMNRYGDVSVQSFSPYRSGGYSYYFDGSGDTLTVDDPFGFGTSDFTVEFWYNPSVQYSSSSTARLLGGEVSGSGATWGVVLSNYNGANGMMFGVGTYGSNTGGRYVNGYWGTKGQWDHIVWQRNSGTIECYINGVSQTLTTMQQNFTWSDGINIANTKNLTIGSTGSADYFTGYIKELRITNGSALYTSGVTVPTEAISVGSANFLGLHLPYLKDASSNDHLITVAGNVSAKPFGPYDYNEYDSATNGGSIVFDGNGDYLSTNETGCDIGSTDFTVDFWYYCRENKSTYCVAGLWSSGSSTRNWSISGGQTVGLGYNSTSGFSSNKTVPLNTWNYYRLTRESGTCKWYVNGELTNTGSVGNWSNLGTVTVGINLEGAPSWSNNGFLTDVRIIKGTAISNPTDVPTAPIAAGQGEGLLLNAYNASIVDKSQSTQLTLVGDTQSSTTVTKYGSSSMYFDGSDRIDLPNPSIPALSGDFTFEAWVYPTAVNYGAIFARGFGNSGGLLIWIQTNFNARFYRDDGVQIDFQSGSSIPANEWTHIAVTRQGSNLKTFINGTVDQTGTMDPANYGLGNTSKFEIGAFNNDQQYFTGYMEDVRITKGLARYTENFTPPTASLEG